MRKILLLGLLAALAFSTGCATVALSADENRAIHRRITEMDMYQIADDWNLIWMMERQSRLNKWYIR